MGLSRAEATDVPSASRRSGEMDMLTHQGAGVRLREDVAQENPQVGRPRLQLLKVLEDGVALEGRRTRAAGWLRGGAQALGLPQPRARAVCPRGFQTTASSPRSPQPLPAKLLRAESSWCHRRMRKREKQEPLLRC